MYISLSHSLPLSSTPASSTDVHPEKPTVDVLYDSTINCFLCTSHGHSASIFHHSPQTVSSVTTADDCVTVGAYTRAKGVGIGCRHYRDVT